MTTWIPRPPSPTEPACWSWPLPPGEDRATCRARLIAENAAKPDPGHRLSDAAINMMLDGGHEWSRFNAFHRGRCAICGHGGRRVEDHCHTSGQTRAWLCRSCNVREGRSGPLPILERFRRVHPAAILNFHEMYSGPDWIDGWSLVQHGDPVRQGLGVRPSTPWPDIELGVVA